MLQTKINKKKQWFLCAKPLLNPKLRLFCFPYAGGGSSIFRGWENGLNSDIELHSAQLPGREKRFMDTPCDSIEDILEGLLEAFKPFIGTPFALFGHSMGALIAFELGRKLNQQFGETPIHLFVSGKGAPHLDNNHPPIYNLPYEEFIQKLFTLNGTPKEVLENRELMEMYEPLLRADFKVCDTYSYQEGALLNCPITIFGGLQDTRISKKDLYDWKELVKGENRVFMLEGDHFFIHKQRDEILYHINEKLGLTVL
ncbi:alpha/beta fold hydrolase [Cytobacillus pseudoceanisediminis]|uniref:Alpha/beta fold hydrolase n=1 Tax=Cytobacillus pseudoceanisediminis TaxID=3051614 RepID=A0ABZ2ZLR1_9BACI